MVSTRPSQRVSNCDSLQAAVLLQIKLNIMIYRLSVCVIIYNFQNGPVLCLQLNGIYPRKGVVVSRIEYVNPVDKAQETCWKLEGQNLELCSRL